MNKTILIKTGLISALLLFISLGTYGATCTAAADGDWNDAGTWSCGRVPQSGDLVIINAGVTVTVDCNCGAYDNMVIYIYGRLEFNNGQKIDLTANGYVEIFTGGSMQGDNSGSKLRIGGSDVYTGPPLVNGPLSYCACGSNNPPTCVCNNPLPVTLAQFKAQLTSFGQVRLDWMTAQEKNNDFFVVERAGDGYTYSDLMTVKGFGNTDLPTHYSVTDEYPLPGSNYYRLRQTDTDGTLSYSTVVHVKTADSDEAAELLLRVYPNPAGRSVRIWWPETAYPASAFIQIYRSTGELVWSVDQYLRESELLLPDLTAGFYQLQVQAQSGTTYRSKLIIE